MEEVDYLSEQIYETGNVGMLSDFVDPKEREAPAYVVWKKRDGTLVRVRDMDDRHLYNTIRMLERTADARVRRMNAEPQQDPDIPKYELTREAVLNRPVYHAMLAVAQARGIDLSENRAENRQAEMERVSRGSRGV